MSKSIRHMNRTLVEREISAEGNPEFGALLENYRNVFGNDALLFLLDEPHDIENVATKELGMYDGNPESDAGKAIIADAQTSTDRLNLELAAYNLGCRCSDIFQVLGEGSPCYYCRENARIMEAKGAELIF